MAVISQIKDRVFYGWVVVGAIFISAFIMMGINSSFGVFFKSLETTFSLTRAETSMILSGRMILCGVFAFLGGWALDRYGPRVVISIMGFFIGLSLILTAQTTAAWQLFITYSLLLAIGLGAIYVVIISTVSRWFNQKRGLALGIATSGSGLGLTFIPPFFAFLIDSLDWRNALMILGGIAWLFILSVSQLLKKDPYEIGALPDGATVVDETFEIKQDTTSPHKVSLFQVFRTTNFWFFLLIWILMGFSNFFMMTHIVPHAIDLGFTAIESAVILSLSGITMIVGRLTAGIITDKLNAKVVAIIYSLLQAAAFLWLVWAQELWMFYLFGLVNGFVVGGFAITMSVLISRTYSLDNIGKILGTIEIGIYIGAAIGPFLGGLIFDISHSYTLAFLIVAGALLTRVPLVALIQRVERRK